MATAVLEAPVPLAVASTTSFAAYHAPTSARAAAVHHHHAHHHVVAPVVGSTTINKQYGGGVQKRRHTSAAATNSSAAAPALSTCATNAVGADASATRMAAEQRRQLAILTGIVNSWLKRDQKPLLPVSVQTEVHKVKYIQRAMSLDPEKLLLPTLIYCGRYAKQANGITTDDLFTLLVTAAVIAMKFWEDAAAGGVDTKFISQVTGRSAAQMGRLERAFLQTINFNLALDVTDLQHFAKTGKAYRYDLTGSAVQHGRRLYRRDDY